MNVPNVSVIIPLFNKEDFVESCLQSLLTQTEKHWECIIVDDGSTDKSVERVTSLVGDDARFKILSQKNAGPSVARNKGIRMATGRMLHFIDADDYYPDSMTLEKMISLYEKYKPKAIAGKIGILEPGSTKIDYDIEINSNSTKWLKVTNMQHDYYFGRFFFDREFIVKNDIQFPEYTYVGEDPVFLVGALSHMDKYVATDVPVYVYNLAGSANNDFYQYDDVKVMGYLRAQKDVVEICIKHKYDKLLERIYNRISNDFILFYMDRSKENPEIHQKVLELMNLMPLELYLETMSAARKDKDRIKKLEKQAEELNVSLTAATDNLAASRELIKQREAELSLYKNPGIKLATRKLAGAIKRRLHKSSRIEPL